MPRVAARRWLLFGLSLASLLAMTYAGVSLAFSLKVTPDVADANPEAKLGSRMIVRQVAAPEAVRTAAEGGEGDLVVSGLNAAGFVAQATNVTVGHALAFVRPDANGTYANASVVSRGNETVNVTALAAGGTGWIVQGANEPAPRFVPAASVLGVVDGFQNATLLPGLFTLAVVGFLAPLVTIVLTHRGGGTRGAPAAANLCRECRAPLASNVDFCIRCGAYARDA